MLYFKDKLYKYRNQIDYIFELVKIVAISLAIILPIRYYLVQPFYVRGASMEPTFHSNEYLIVNEIGYRFELPKRGDVVVFKNPNNKKQYFIKRIIGLPGERVVIKDNKVIVYNNDNKDGFELNERYLSTGEVTDRGIDVILGDDKFFVLGDNRDNSMDSRMFGSVDRDLIIGRAWFRGFPFNKFGFLDETSY